MSGFVAVKPSEMAKNHLPRGLNQDYFLDEV